MFGIIIFFISLRAGDIFSYFLRHSVQHVGAGHDGVDVVGQHVAAVLDQGWQFIYNTTLHCQKDKKLYIALLSFTRYWKLPTKRGGHL